MKEGVEISIAWRLRTLYARLFPLYDISNEDLQGRQYLKYVEKFDQEANDFIYELLKAEKPCMISKFGTYELDAIEEVQVSQKTKLHLQDYIDFICNKRTRLDVPKETLTGLCYNAGFFPCEESLLKTFYEIYVDALKQIDVLGSYQITEYMFRKELQNAVRVNLDGYYAPFYYKNPWTKHLKGKRVLVIHPFSDDIESQYMRRDYLWEDENVLPEFTLITYKAVQSIAGEKTEFATWFDALQKMKDDIKKLDYDVALIGCGAYGMPLAAFCKQMGKQAIHLAGWLQILFGIKGTRWDNNPRVSQYYNEYWIRPSEKNRPKGSGLIENGCYW